MQQHVYPAAMTRKPGRRTGLLVGLLATSFGMLSACNGSSDNRASNDQLVAEGRQVFRYDTFGDEAFWTGTLRMNEVIQQAVDPVTALSVGLKVDVEALPDAVVAGIQDGTVDLSSTQTTLALLELDAVVGLKGQVETSIDGVKRLTQVGITCALCHSTVSEDVEIRDLAGNVLIPAGNVGRRLDGWPNRDLDPGAIIALSPVVAGGPSEAYFKSWGPGKFDPRHNVDNREDYAVVIPPAFGLSGLSRSTFTGDGDTAHEPAGPVAYWNRYVSVVEMGGQGTFSDPRLPLNVDHTNGGVLQDLVTGELPALQAYQYSLAAPAAPSGSFEAGAALRGKALFEGQAQCASCHSGPNFTDANESLHAVGDSAAAKTTYASRSATKLWRTTPLRGIWQHPPYFHDGSAATLADVVNAYNAKLNLGLTEEQKADLVEYMKSL